jgi:plastocyanin
MTTYTTTFDLATAQTGASGHYPLLVKDSTYTPDNTIYAKVGDTVKFVVSEPSPDGASVSYNNIDNVAWTDTEPDPDEFDAGTTNQSSPSSWEYTITSAAEDSEFYWWWFGTTVHSSGSGKKYSQRVRVNRIVGAPRINGGTSAVTVTQGGTITFSVTGLSGLLTSGTNSNCLYFSVFNSSNQWVTTTGTSGLSWDSGTNQLGKVKTSDGNTVLTVGSSMATGTYNVYLTHFNAADSPGGNDFMGSENRLGPDGSTHGTSAAALQFTVQASNAGTVSGLSLGANVTATTLSQVVERNSGTITCDPTTFQPTSSVSDQTGAAGAKQRLGGTSNNYSTSDLTLNNGESVDFYMVGPAGYTATTTGRLTIAEDHDDLSVTTGSDPGGGEGSGGGATAGTYGLKITNADGDQIFGVGQKGNTVILTETRSALAHNATDGPFTLPVAAADNTSTKVAIVIIDMYTGTTGFNWPQWVITRSGATFSVQNLSGVSRAYRYIAIRI